LVIILKVRILTLLMKILQQKVSFIEILQVFGPFSAFGGLIYILYLQNEQLSELTKRFSQTQESVRMLEGSYEKLLDQLGEKDAEILKFLHASSSKNSPLPDLLNNEMTQFYIKSAGVVILGLVVLGGLSYIFPAAFSLKSILPVSVYTTIQDWSPFLQQKETFFHQEYGLDWLVEVVNNKKIVRLDLKPDSKFDYIDASSYILELQADLANACNSTPYGFNNPGLIRAAEAATEFIATGAPTSIM
jgi:hypothetical protein